jgi:regulator of sigma E protease
MFGILITLGILSILVIIHELGHYLVAKKLGIKVEEFGFGFPPKAWGKKIGETIYTINWLPIGGFVKLFGEDDAGGGKLSTKDPTAEIAGEDVKRAFFARPVGQRALVVVAGVVMNALLAFLIYYLYLGMSNYKVELPLLTNHKFVAVTQLNINENDSNPVITYVSPDSPAAKIGIKAPAKILSVNNKSVKSVAEIIKTINANKGKKLPISWAAVRIEDAQVSVEKEHKAFITPRAKHAVYEGPTGIAFFPVAYLFYRSPVEKVFSGITHPVNLMAYNFSVLGSLISQAFESKSVEPLSQSVSGPVGVVSLGGMISKIPDSREQFLQFLNLAGILSISLAFFNVLPIPALDGGRLFFILIEGLTGKKISPRIEGMIHTVGMTVLMALILLITFKDLLQLIK